MTGRSYPSSIDRLPAEIREEIGRLREAGHTFDEILGKLRELDVDVSRSALGRHLKSMKAVGERLRQSREAAETLADRLDLKKDNKIARLNVELMHDMVYRLGAAEEDGEPILFKPQELFFLSKALESIVNADKNVLTLAKAREQWIREQAERAEAAAVVGAKRGLSADAVAAMKAAFLGIS